MRSHIAILLFIIIANACKDPFSPEPDPSNRELLIVEGHLNIGGITTLTLSRSADLQDLEFRRPEPNARVQIEENGVVVAEAGSGENGVCTLLTHNLEISKRYKVSIRPAGGKIYETDYLEGKVSPDIDSVGFQIEGRGFKIYLNTHDATNSTRFYSWDFFETWEIQSPYPSFWELKDGKIVERDRSINLSRCWQENSSSTILLSSTERLSEDRVSEFPLAFVPGNSIRFNHMYSILVKQYGLTREGYQYLETMKKNTEEIGTIFDSQPSELRGNIRCITKPEELVIGWISAGSVSEKRIFIKRSARPAGWGYQDTCEPPLLMHADTVLNYLQRGYLIGYRNIWSVSPVPRPWKLGDTSYTVAPKECVDCRLRGSNIKPSYWPD